MIPSYWGGIQPLFQIWWKCRELNPGPEITIYEKIYVRVLLAYHPVGFRVVLELLVLQEEQKQQIVALRR